MACRQRYAVIATIAILMACTTQHGAHGLRVVHTHTRRASSTRMSSTIDRERERERTSPLSVLQRISQAASYLVRNPLRVQYATAMGARFSWFLNQGIALSLSGIDKSSESDEEKMRFNRQGLSVPSVMGALVDAIIADDDNQSPSSSSSSGFASSSSSSTSASASALQTSSSDMTDEQRALFGKNFASIIRLLRQDLRNIEEGVYKFPYDMRPSYRAQWGGPQVLAQLQAYVADRREVLARRDRRDGFEIREKFASPRYPAYYLQNFHYQTDGWMSAKSALLYDYQVESLFLGTADAMRRQIMPSFAQFMGDKKRSGVDPAMVRVLDVAAGTGRFISFVLDNYPSLDTTVLDLSPFYLAEAKKLLSKYGSNVRFVEAAVEGLPFDDASFDAITCVYLFHELPRQIRVQAVKEFARVLKPGGKLFFVDSAQRGEVPYERVLEGFTITAHEPYYLDYTETDLPAMFAEGGLRVEASEVNWVSKCVTCVKE